MSCAYEQRIVCMACTVAFDDVELQRDHYKSDWHRYNLKRKMVQLPPIRLVEFEGRMKQKKAEEKQIEVESNQDGYCVCCRKHFGNKNAYQNHLLSKKHKVEQNKFDAKKDKAVVARNRYNREPSDDEMMEEDSDVESVDSEEWNAYERETKEAVLKEDCLFCDHHSRTIDNNLEHMSSKHSFFVPDIEYVCDLQGLMVYLGEKVGQGLMCLWCNSRSRHFRSLQAVQKHMRDKGHCMIQRDNDAMIEYTNFYDFSASYPDNGNDISDDDEEEVNVDVLEDEGYELVLPSGVRIGHRSLKRYYQQSLPPDRQALVPQRRRLSDKLLHQYKALGYSGLSVAEAKIRARDERCIHRYQAKMGMHVGVKSNKLVIRKPR